MVHDKLRLSFGQLAEKYEDARPGYPAELVNDVVAISNLFKDSKLLEVGCGTGKATVSFAGRGFSLTALDISENLVLIAKKRLNGLSNIEFIVDSFEKAPLPKNYYDLIFAAQAWHWIDPTIGYRKAASSLTKTGHIAFFSNVQDPQSSLEKKIRRLYAEYCPDFWGEEYGTLNDLKKQFEESGLFQGIQRKEYARNLQYTKEKYLKLLESFSWVSTSKNKQKFFESVQDLLATKDTLTIPTNSVLLIGRKK